MDVKLVTVLVVLAVTVSQTSETLFPGAFGCCMKISEKIPRIILGRVNRVEIQKADGPCHLEAVILYVRGKKLCVNPRIRRARKLMEKIKHKIHKSKPHVRKQRRARITKKEEEKQ